MTIGFIRLKHLLDTYFFLIPNFMFNHFFSEFFSSLFGKLASSNVCFLGKLAISLISSASSSVLMIFLIFGKLASSYDPSSLGQVGQF